MSAQVITENTHLAGARGASSKEDCMKFYDQWAANYNSDLSDASQNYVAPIHVAQAALRSSNKDNMAILDAGCGTGLVGEALAKGGTMIIDGLDLSPPMLKVAEETGVYRKLAVCDLTQPIDIPDNTYDMVTCCGTFTRGHVGPDPALREFVRVIKKGGLIIATILHEIWLSGGYQAEVEKLAAEGLVRVASAEIKDYRKGAGDKATLLILEKTR